MAVNTDLVGLARKQHAYGRGLIQTEFSSSSVADGVYEFTLNSCGFNNLLDSLVFTPAATAGSILVQTSPNNGVTWDNMAAGGVINAASSADPAYTKPQGKGTATKLRLTLTGVTGATSFKGVFSQWGI